MSKPDERNTISQNRAFDILSNARRRFILSYLSQTEGPVELRELADEVARWETGSESLSRKERKRVYVSLYQTHIPRLKDAGVIDYDPDSGLVQLVDRARDIDRYISKPTEDSKWPLYHFLGAVVGTVFYALVLLDVIPFVSEAVGGILVLGILLALGIAHLIDLRRRRTLSFQSEEFVEDLDG